MFEAILSIVDSGLELLNKLVPDQALRIAKETKELREKWYAEVSKGDKMDDALVAMYTRELLDIGQLFSAALKSASTKN